MIADILMTIAVGFWAFVLGAALAARSYRDDIERADRMSTYWRDLYWCEVRRRGQTVDATLVHPPQDAQYRPERLH